MCRSIAEGGRRCDGREKWCVSREGHARFSPDTGQERHWHRPAPLLSMTAGAISMRRHRARKYGQEVDAVRTVHGVKPHAPVGPVLRESLWEARYRGTTLTTVALAERFRALAAEEGVPVETIAARYEQQQLTPHRQAAGQRLADLVVDPVRPDWVNEDHLVEMIEPLDNGTPSEGAYVRVVRDAEGQEWTLVTSYDGSEPQVWPATEAGRKAAAWEALERVRAVQDDRAGYEQWLDETGNRAGDAAPYTQSMFTGDFLSHTGDNAGMHLV